jgi:hypothetical protein
MQGEFEQLAGKIDQLYEYLKQAGNLSDEALGLCGIGIVCMHKNDPDGAAERFEHGLSLFRLVGDKWGTAFARATGRWRSASKLSGATARRRGAAQYWETGDRTGSSLIRLAMALLAERPEWAYFPRQSGYPCLG